MPRLTTYTKAQLYGRLGRQGHPTWQIDRAFTLGAIPAPDAGTSWSASAVDTLTANWDTVVVLATGTEEPVASTVFGHRLTAASGFEVRGDVVRGLHRRGLLASVGVGHYDALLFDLREVPRLAALPDLAQLAAEDALLGPDQAAQRIGLRRTDFDHTVRLGWITPTEVREVKAEWKQILDVSLYRTADVDALLTRAEVDWAAVLATPKGSRSPLAKIPTPPAD
ncbi:hypothetical protein ACEZCY_14055 [Streptacidiphilus sp. N1-12]|uniref:Uncharacterized protein n=2 Tax=Streptacidiphilus alkalitolerans TaxID=3342712 RepID=A0ABV6V9I0_9ACTN